MITILAHIFIKDRDGSKARKQYGTLCGIVGIMLNVFLFAVKYFAGVISASVAITADAFNNLSDAFSSLVTLTGFVVAEKKADEDHPFGHGRYEYISGLVVSMAIILMGFELLKSSVKKIIAPVEISADILTILILVLSICIKIYISVYNSRIGKRIDSSAMRATSVDSLSDVAATSVVLISVLIVKFTGINLDGICGVLVALFILYAGCKAAKETITPLLGLPPEKEFLKEIESIALAHEIVEGVHDIVVHDYGPGRRMISLHAEVPGDKNIYEIHDMIDELEHELNEKMMCETVIHMDPIEKDNEEMLQMKQTVAELVKEIDDRITIHDFRMVKGSLHTKLVFDAFVPFEVKKSLAEVKAEIESRVGALDGNYVAAVRIDQSYV